MENVDKAGGKGDHAPEDVYDGIKDVPALISLAKGIAFRFYKDFPIVD